MDEKELVLAAKAGDKEAFDTLVRDCITKVQSLLKKNYRLQHADVEDITQNATLKAWTKIKAFRGESLFLTWFFTISRNEALNFMQKNGIDRKEISSHIGDDEEHCEDYDNILALSIDKKLEDNAIAVLERQETLNTYRQILEDVLKQLSPIHREVLQLVLEDGLSYKEVADILQVPLGTVMSRVFFARKHAQKLIEQHAKHNEIQLPCLGKREQHSVS
jgi:RNA polymerase sigma-70 factor (ECF subfamily)